MDSIGTASSVSGEQFTFSLSQAILSILFDRGFLILLLLAVSTIIYSSIHVLRLDRNVRNNCAEEPVVDVRAGSGLIFPIAGSVSLLLLFYFFNFFGQILAIVIAFSCLSSLGLVLFPIVRIFCSIWPGETRPVNMPLFGAVSVPALATAALSTTLVVLWLLSGHWVLNDLLGVGICVAAIALLRFPSIKISSVTMFALFVYDIFWVFFSKFFFHENVMVAVATQQPENPIHAVAERANVSTAFVSEKLDLPMKLMVPRKGGFSMLGLGDIVLPGMLIAFAFRFDHIRWSRTRSVRMWFTGYGVAALLGYTVGLFMGMTSSIYFHHAQPALLFVVPLTMSPILVLAYLRSELESMWKGLRADGSMKEGDDEPETELNNRRDIEKGD